MASYCSIRQSVLEDVREALKKEIPTEWRNTYEFTDNETIRINSVQDNSKTKVQSHHKRRQQAYEIADWIKDRVIKIYNGKVIPTIIENSVYDPIKVDLTVSQKYIEHLYETKLTPDRQNEPSIKGNDFYMGDDALREQEEKEQIYNQLTNDPFVIKEMYNELNEKLVEFLKPLGISVEMLNSLKERTGVDAIGASDIINKIILVNQGKADISTLPEETAHFFVELLGRQNKLQKSLINKISDWEGYESVRKEYYDIYNGNENKIRKEAIGKLVAHYIVNNKDAPKGFLEDIKRLIQEALKLFGITNVPIHGMAQDIAADILTKDYTKIKRTMPSGSRLTNYESTLENNPDVKELAQNLKDVGLQMTGSLSLRKQGTIYRTKDENVHDLDFKVPPSIRDSYIEKLKTIYPEFNVAHEFKTPRYNVKVAVINGISVDFFEDRVHKNSVDSENNVSWQDIFEAKLDIGREKDMVDFMVYNPTNKDNEFDNNLIYFQNNISEETGLPEINFCN